MFGDLAAQTFQVAFGKETFPDIGVEICLLWVGQCSLHLVQMVLALT